MVLKRIDAFIKENPKSCPLIFEINTYRISTKRFSSRES